MAFGMDSKLLINLLCCFSSFASSLSLCGGLRIGFIGFSLIGIFSFAIY
jgi:hypothetical protein